MQAIAKTFKHLLIILVILAALPQASMGKSAATPQTNPHAVSGTSTRLEVGPDTYRADKIANTNSKQIDRWITLSDQFNNRLLSTVYYSLGIVATTLLVLVGYSWFTNSKSYEKDRVALRIELKAEIATELSAVRNSLAEQHATQLAEIETTVDRFVDKKTDDIFSKIKYAESKFDSHVSTMGNELRYLKMDILGLQSFRWESEGVVVNAITNEISRGKLAKDYISNLQLDYIVERIENLINKATYSGDWEPKVLEFLDDLPPRYESFKARIRDRLQNLKEM